MEMFLKTTIRKVCGDKVRKFVLYITKELCYNHIAKRIIRKERIFLG